jgi:flagellin-specific chaperone FliS
LSLGAVYEWALREIISARNLKNPDKIQGVLEVLAPLYEAWIALAPKETVGSRPLESTNQASSAQNVAV